MRLAFLSGLLVAALAVGNQGFAQAQAQANQPLKTHQLAANVYWIEGGGGNSGVIVGDEGVIVIDAKSTAAGGKELLQDIAQITPKPVVTVIETHSDFDHVNGLASFPAGLRIIAHENNKRAQEAELAVGGNNLPPADRLPTEVVTKNKEVLTIEGVKLELLHWAPAHTSGDLVIYLPVEKIVFAGDIVEIGQPTARIHPEEGGSSTGWLESIQGMMALNANEYVAGHGDLASKAAVETLLTKTVNIRAQVAELVKQGKTLAEIQGGIDDPAPPPPNAPAGSPPRVDSYIKVVYQELTQPAK